MQTTPPPHPTRVQRRPTSSLPTRDRPGHGAAHQPALYDRVLIAVGGEAPLGDVIALAERATHPKTGQVRVLHFRTWHSQARSARDHPLAGDAVFLETREQALELTSALIDEFARRGVRADGLVLDSPPRGLGRLIARFARDWQAQAIVIDDRGPTQPVGDSVLEELRPVAPCRLLAPGTDA